MSVYVGDRIGGKEWPIRCLAVLVLHQPRGRSFLFRMKFLNSKLMGVWPEMSYPAGYLFLCAAGYQQDYEKDGGN